MGMGRRDTIEVSFRYAGHAVFVILLCVLVTCALPASGMTSAGHHFFQSSRTGRGVSLIQADTQTVGVDLPNFGAAGPGEVRAPRRCACPSARPTAESASMSLVLRC